VYKRDLDERGNDNLSRFRAILAGYPTRTGIICKKPMTMVIITATIVATKMDRTRIKRNKVGGTVGVHAPLQ